MLKSDTVLFCDLAGTLEVLSKEHPGNPIIKHALQIPHNSLQITMHSGGEIITMVNTQVTTEEQVHIGTGNK